MISLGNSMVGKTQESEQTIKKIQTKAMKDDIERTKDLSVAWLQGGKAVGELVRPKKKIKK